MQHGAPLGQFKSVLSPPGDNALAWDASDYLSDKVGGHGQSLPHLMRILKDMQKTLDRTRTAYNQALQDRDDERAKLQEAEARLGSVQRVVQRYAGVQEPVVASDGYTYERAVIQQYLSECKSSDTNAYSQQTKEVLSNNLVPNESLKKLVDLLRQVRPTDVAPASKATTIPPYRSNVNFLEEEEKAATKAAEPKAAEAAPTSAATTSTAQPKRDENNNNRKDREERPSTNNNNNGPNKGGKAQPLHPCLRVYGFCNFKDDCSFAKYPYDACLNYIKGKCRFGDGCKELHVNLRETKYTNANAVNNHHNPNFHSAHHRHADPNARAAAAAAKDGEKKAETSKPAPKEAKGNSGKK